VANAGPGAGRIPIAPAWKIGTSTISTPRQPSERSHGSGQEIAMSAKINHVAIVSENYAQLAQFYQAVFGMQTSDKTRPGRAVTVGDGYVGLKHQSAPCRALRRPRSLRHPGRGLRDGVRAHAQELTRP